MQSWKTSTSFFWETTPFFRLLLPVIVAILCYECHYLPHINYRSLFISLIICSFLVFGLSYFKNRLRLSSALITVLIFLSLFILGWFACYIFDIQNDPAWFGNKLSTSNYFVAKVTSAPTEKDRTWKLEVAINKAMNGNQNTNAVGNAFVYVYKNETALDIHEGDKILLPNKWIRIKNSGNPFEFDYASFLKRHNIYYQEFIATNEIEKINAQPESPSILDRWHKWGMMQLAHYVKDKNSIGLLQAMLLGDKINFDTVQRQMYVETGIVHIVAISGAHIAFLLMIITAGFFWLKHKKYQWIKYFVAVPVIWLYVFMAGAPASAIRAATMFSLLSLGFLFQKNNNPLNQLCAAAFIILLSKPFWLFTVGFQLSFLAVLSIILFYKSIRNLWLPQNTFIRKLWNAIAVSLSVEILVAPLVIYYFHIFPVAFILSNIFAWLVMGVIMSAGMLILCFSGVPLIANFIAYSVSKLVAGFNYLLSLFQLLNPPSFKLLYLSDLQLLLLYLLIIGLVIFFIQKHKYGLFTGLMALLALLISFGINNWQILQQRKFIVYNINRKSYAELIEGTNYKVILDDSLLDEKTKKYTAGAVHIVAHSHHQIKNNAGQVIKVGNEKLLILNSPLNIDSNIHFNVDYLLINYPIKKFTAIQLKRFFHFKKLIVPGNEKRYIAERWNDSCDKYNIDAHFTLLDGAFILSE